MGRKPKKKRIDENVRLAAFEKQCHLLATAVKEIKKNINALLTADEAAKMCAMSKSSFLKLANTGKAPEGLKLERLRRWRRREILGWISAGCPDREKWEWMKDAADSSSTKQARGVSSEQAIDACKEGSSNGRK